MTEPRILITGLAIGESPRWHEERLWFSNWGTQQVVAMDIKGNSDVMARVPTTIPFSIDWLPDGRLLVVSGPEARLLRREPDGTLVTHADLSGLAEDFNEIVVDARGNAYVNGGSFDFETFAGVESGVVALVRPDGSARQVADNIAFGGALVVEVGEGPLLQLRLRDVLRVPPLAPELVEAAAEQVERLSASQSRQDVR